MVPYNWKKGGEQGRHPLGPGPAEWLVALPEAGVLRAILLQDQRVRNGQENEKEWARCRGKVRILGMMDPLAWGL